MIVHEKTLSGSTARPLAVGVIGGLGFMASPMAKHWRGVESVKVLRVHDRMTVSERKDRCRSAWKDYGAALVHTIEELVGNKDLDGVIVCCGKNGDDLPIIAELADLLAKQANDPFICHMSTVSVNFVKAAYDFCLTKQVRYVNFPLTGSIAGAENATMLILASGDRALCDALFPSLSIIGKPKNFGSGITAGAEVKFIGHLMVFNGLMGISSAAALHTACLNNNQLGGAAQSDFFDFLNQGAGSTKQWDIILSNGIRNDIWNAPFFIKYAVVDAIYAAQLCMDQGISALCVEAILNVALAFSYVLNHVDAGLATHAIAREFVKERAAALDQFVQKHAWTRGDLKSALSHCVDSLPVTIRKTVKLDVTFADFTNAI